MSKKDTVEDSSWSASDEDMVEDGSVDKVPKSQDKDQDVMVKRQSPKDSFHPHELYLYFEFGPAILGDSNNVFFFKDTESIQDDLTSTGGGGRQKHRSDHNVEMEHEDHSGKVTRVV